MLRSLYEYRWFILSSIRGDIQMRFARSRLGGLWFVLHPLAQALMFAIVLSEVLAARLPESGAQSSYAIYVLSGMAAWGLFSEILGRSMSIFLEQAPAMKKIAFPRLSLPLIVMGSALSSHLILLAAILLIFLGLGHPPGLAWFVLPLGMVLISMLAFGIGVICGVLNVFSRDVAQVVTVVLQLWFWATPIIYPASVVPEGFRIVLALNPVVPLVELYHDALLYDRGPALQGLIVPTLAGLVLVVLAFVVFRRASPELVDAL